MRIVHVISGLGVGGAERSLLNLLRAPALAMHEQHVVSLADGGYLASEVREAAASLVEVGLDRSLLSGVAVWLVGDAIAGRRPDLVQGWMYHANVAASAAALMRRFRAPVLWSIRQGLRRMSDNRLPTRFVIAAGSAISFQPQRIIYNSRSAAGDHERIGYRAEKSAVIFNGIDTDRFAPDPTARRDVRRMLGVSDNAVIAVRLARDDPMKDTPTLLAAFSLAARTRPDLHLLLAGEGMSPTNEPLMRQARNMTPDGHGADLSARIHMVGRQDDPCRILAACDFAVSSSAHSEGFPNAVAEAMACALPVVGTAVGETSHILGDMGQTVLPSDPVALGAAIAGNADMSAAARHDLGLLCRDRISTSFSVARYANAFSGLWEQAARRSSVHSG